MDHVSREEGGDGRTKLDLRKLEQFVAVAEELHFHRAAERLNMSQPPLTVAIRKLEEDIGVSLIQRGSNRVIGLTAAGEAFLKEARETLRQTERAVRAARDTAEGRTGVVRIGYVGSALYGRLPAVIRAFQNDRPDVRLELREATTAAQIAALERNTMDVGFVIPPLPDEDDFAMRPFDTDRLCLALPTDHRLANDEEVALSGLADEPFVLWPMAEGRGFHLQAIRLCTDARFSPNIRQEAHGMHAVLSLVAVGLGVSIVPESMNTFRPDRIAYRSLGNDSAKFEVCLASGANPTPAVEAFIATCSS